MMSLYADTSRLRTWSADWKAICDFCIDTMVCSRLTLDGSVVNTSDRRVASSWDALTDFSALSRAPVKDTGVPVCTAARLRELSAVQPLRPQEREDRMRILRNIIANDAEIRRICQPLPRMLDSQAFYVGEASTTLH